MAIFIVCFTIVVSILFSDTTYLCDHILQKTASETMEMVSCFVCMYGVMWNWNDSFVFIDTLVVYYIFALRGYFDVFQHPSITFMALCRLLCRIGSVSNSQ